MNKRLFINVFFTITFFIIIPNSFARQNNLFYSSLLNSSKAEIFIENENDIFTLINKSCIPFHKELLNTNGQDGKIRTLIFLNNQSAQSINLVLYPIISLQNSLRSPIFIKRQLSAINVLANLLSALLIILCLFIMLIWIYSKEKCSFYYLIGLLLFSFHFFALDNLFTDIFSIIFGEFFIKVQLIFAQASILFYVLFSEKFIEIEDIDKTSRKLLSVFKSIIALNIIFILLWFAVGYIIYSITIVLYCALIIYIIVKKKTTKLFYNKIIILAILGLFIFQFLDILADLSFINSLLLVESGAEYGMCFQLLLFIMAIIIKLIDKKTVLIQQLQEKIDEKSAIYTKQQLEIQAHQDNLRDASDKLIEIVELKEGLTSMIVHDLKIPLHNIINCPEEFESGKQLHMIKQSGKNMLNMVNNILDVYKYEKSGLNLDQQNINVNTLINSVYEQVELLASQKNVSICFNIPSNLDIFADYSIIERVFVNLLTNAIKYTPANGRIVVDYNKNKDNEYQFEVIDSGPGIPKEKKDLVFVKFGQILAKKTGEIRSTGLGLTFCKIAVEAHNGKIGFENLEPLGTKFWFSIPSVKFDEFTSQTTKTVLATDRAEDYIKKITVESRAYLKPYISILKDIEIYHISRIRQVLKNIEEINGDIQIWKDLIIDAVYSNNQQLYHYLLQLDD